MKLYVLLIALLMCVGALLPVQGRAVDDIDNSIEGNEPVHKSAGKAAHTRFEQDWIKFTKAPPAKILQTLGTPVEIVCEVMGSQVPTIEWVTGRISLPELDSLESNAVSESSSSAIVRVRSVQLINHMLSEPRTYTCVGHTGSKTVYASTVVYPQTKFKDLVSTHEGQFMGPHKPRIIYSEKLHLDLVGSNIMLPCKVHSRPHAEIFWMNSDGNLIEQSQRFKVLPTGDLLISDIKWEDMGAYKCIARNGIGKDTAETFIYPVLKEEEN